jgi:tetratricopeptide (TPR) repeat protein
VARQGDLEGAEQLFRHVLEILPNHAEALAGVGQSLCWRQRRRQGLEYLRRSAKQVEKVAAKKKEIGLLLQLADQLRHWGDLGTAVSLAQLAVRVAPGSATAQNQLALCLSRINRPQEALGPAQKACELLPQDPGCQTNLALIESRTGSAEQALSRLQAVAAGASDPEQISRARLETGLIRDKRGQYDLAFEAFSDAADIARQLPSVRAVPANRIFDSLARNRAGFDSELLRRWRLEDFADDLPRPVFLFGFLRSGTTLLERALDAHPAVVTSDEEQFMAEVAQQLANMTGIQDDPARALRAVGLPQARELRRFYWQRVTEEYGDAVKTVCFVDKVALNTVEAGLISSLFPEAKILFALRDPRDVVLSCYMQPFTATTATVNLLSWDGICRQYAGVMSYWLHLRPLMQPLYLQIRYEDTVSEFEPTLRRVFQFLQVDWNPAVHCFHENAKGRYISTPSFDAVSRPLYGSAVARWRHYAHHFESVLPTLQPFITEFGY